MLKWIQIGLILTLPFTLPAQVLSQKGRFSVEFDKGCIPLTVNITELDTFGQVSRQYFYFSGAVITNSRTFTYQEPGTYTIIQRVGVNDFNDEEKSDTLIIEALEAVEPQIEISRCNNLQIAITSLDSHYDSVRVYFGGTDSVTLQTNEQEVFTFDSPGNQTIGLKGLYANADENCQTYFEEVLPLPDIVVPAIADASVKEICQDSYALLVTLAQFQEEVIYRVIFNQSGAELLYEGFLDSTRILLPVPSFSRSDYCVSINAYDPCSRIERNSNEICETPTPLSLSPFESLYATYEEAAIFINVDEIPSGEITVQRRFEGGNFENRPSATGPFLDPIGSPSRKWYYQLNYVDSCGSILYTAETHPPFVEAVPILDNRYDISITPPQSSLSAPINYAYEVGNPGNLRNDEATGPFFQLNLSIENGVPRQQLTIYSEHENGVTLQSNTLNLKAELLIYVPSAFTPNDDGLNDELRFYGVSTRDASVTIYTRWGQTIYQSTDLSLGWDGNAGGRRAPEGTYLYEIIFETTDGRKLKQRGSFALLK